jgi:serine/threonine protein kinase
MAVTYRVTGPGFPTGRRLSPDPPPGPCHLRAQTGESLLVIDRLAAAHQVHTVSFVAGTTDIREASPPSQDRSVHKRQGRYVLGDLLGRGGMAEVFSGHAFGSHGFQKPVAIKRLLPELANDHVFVDRLIGEAKLLVGLQHGNIVSVLDLARDGEDVFLVMDFVDGPSLRQLLKALGQRSLPLGVATYIVQSAAQGLEFAHARPGGAVIHADISPSNLLLTTSGEVRVADFGIARREGGGAGIVEGKWAYMAPEQARGEALTPRSDVFALGVVMYELLTGQHPLGHQVTPDVRELDPVRIAPPRTINPKLPAGLDAICMKALANDPHDRYARMQQLIDAIIDERFNNGYREGANDLAQLIRESTPGGAAEVRSSRTQVTDRPVTLMTRSLISEPVPRISDPSIRQTPTPRAAGTTPPPVFELPSASKPAHLAPSGARTLQLPAEVVVPTLQFQPSQLPRGSYPLLPAPELASVHGGATAHGHVLAAESRVNKWTIMILGMAALVGVIAAVAIELAPDAMDESKSVAPVELPKVVAMKPEPTVTPPPITQPAQPQPVEQNSEATPPPAPPTVEDKPPVEQKPAVDEPKPIIAARQHKTHVAPVVKKQPAAASGESTIIVRTLTGDWAHVQIGSDMSETPHRFKLEPGTYLVRLKDDEFQRSCQVTIGGGQVLTLTVDMEEGGCEPR